MEAWTARNDDRRVSVKFSKTVKILLKIVLFLESWIIPLWSRIQMFPFEFGRSTPPLPWNLPMVCPGFSLALIPSGSPWWTERVLNWRRNFTRLRIGSFETVMGNFVLIECYYIKYILSLSEPLPIGTRLNFSATTRGVLQWPGIEKCSMIQTTRFSTLQPKI